jgi:2-keto-4-pentenoate hydratase
MRARARISNARCSAHSEPLRPDLPQVFRTATAARAVQAAFAPDKVVVRIGYRFGLVAPALAKRMKLKRLQAT